MSRATAAFETASVICSVVYSSWGDASTPASARKGTIARSWNSSTPKARRPCVRLSSSCSVSWRSTIAVEDIATAPPSRIATGSARPIAQPTAATTAVVPPTCRPPSVNTSPRIAIRRGSENSRPSANSRNTMPNSASVSVVSVGVTQPSAWGPTLMPTIRKASISGRRKRRRPTTTASVAMRSSSTSSRTLFSKDASVAHVTGKEDCALLASATAARRALAARMDR